MATEAETKAAEIAATTAASAGAGAAASDANAEQSRSKAFEAAEHHKTEAAKLRTELDALKAKTAKDAEDSKNAKLKEDGKWQDLATKHESEAKASRAALRNERIQRALFTAGAKADAADAEDIGRFTAIPDDLNDADTDALNAFAASATEKVLKAKPYLVKQPAAKTEVKTNNANTKPGSPGGGVSAAIDANAPFDQARAWKDPAYVKAYRDKR